MHLFRALAPVILFAPAILRAQDTTLQVLRHAPGDTASAGNVVTVTFDRPVAGRLDATIEAAKVFHITPATPGRIAWRDPITIRFVPDEPLAPGSVYAVTVDTTFRALDGTRLETPYRFSFRVPGPRLLARSFGGEYGQRPPAILPLDGKIQLLYSAEVDLARLARGSRLRLDSCVAAGSVPLRPVRQRPVVKTDRWQFTMAGGWGRDTIADRFRRIVELEPATALPPDCVGQLVLPTTIDDSVHGREERFVVQTYASFRLKAFDCGPTTRCPVVDLAVEFTAPVKREDALRYIRLEPAAEIQSNLPTPEAARWPLRVPLAPRTTYTLIVSDSLRDVHGRPLEGVHRARFLTGDFIPAIGYPRGPLSVPRSGPGTIPVRHVNVRAIRVSSYRIPDSLFPHVLAIPPWRLLGYDLSRLKGVSAETSTVVLEGKFNTQYTTQLPLPRSVASSRAGLVALRLEVASAMTGPDPDSLSAGVTWSRARDWLAGDFAVLQVTDLAIHAKLAPGRGTVLVTGLTDGRPRAGALVRQVNAGGQIISQGMTGRDGVAELRLPAGMPVVAAPARRPISSDWPPRVGLIEAIQDSDRIVTPLSARTLGYEDANPLDPSRLGARRSAVPRAAAGIFTDRGIYRPGEMVYLKGMLRYGVLGALTLPRSSDSARLTVIYRRTPWSGDDNVVIRDTVFRISGFGSVADSFRLLPGVPLGEYLAELKVPVDSDWVAVGSQAFRVAEYRAPEFLVEVRADSGIHYGSDTARIDVSARYLFGAPMGRAALNWSAVLREPWPWESRIPGAEGWTVGAWDWWSEPTQPQPPQTQWGVDSLDASGRATLRIPLARLRPSRPGRLTISVGVTDINRQAVTASADVDIHATQVYILARHRPGGWLWKTGERATVDVRTVRPDGSPIPGVPVVASVVRRIWQGYGEGRISPWVDEAVRTDTIHTDDRATAAYAIVPPVGGAYEVRFSTSDGRGGLARTTLGAYAMGPGADWWTGSAFQLPLITENRELRIGEEARVSFESPFDSADAWVTVERERVLQHWRVPAHRGSNVVRLALAERHVPNVFLSIFLVRRNGPQRPDAAAQLLRVGYTELRVKTSSKRLAVDVQSARAEYRPSDTAVVSVRVRDAAGRGVRGEVTLWAVDQGVLALTKFETPDVLARLYAPRGIGAGLWSSIPTVLTADPGLVVELARQAAVMLSMAVAGNPAIDVRVPPSTSTTVRTQFRSTAFYIASVVTDPTGRAVIRVRVPDNLTTFRVMAVASSGADRFGSGDTTLLVTRQLVARPTLPRFVRASDTLQAGAAVNARDARSRPATVEATSTGITLQGTSRRAIVLAAGKGAEARFQFAVPPRDSARDSVTVQFRASDGANADAVAVRLPVRPDFYPRAHTQFGSLRHTAEVVLSLPADIDPTRSRLALRVGTSPLAPMIAAYDWLRVYPYYCSEQIVSGGRALLAIWRATRDRDPNALGGDPRPRLQELADELARRQRSDGAIRYWDDYDWSTPWLSVYAGLYLLEARDAGISVDKRTLDRLSRYLSAVAVTPVDTGGMNRFQRRSRRLALGGRIAVVEYLRRAAAPNVGAENALLAVASQMTWEDRLRLAEVLATRDDVREQMRSFVDAAWRAVTAAGLRVDLPDSAYGEREFPSRVAPAARLLTASLALRPDHPWLGGLIETVLQHGKAEGRWSWTTQDYASVVLAMAALSESAGDNQEIRVVSGERTLLTRRAGASDTTSVPLTGLLESSLNGSRQLRVRLTKSAGGKRAYYALTLTEVPGKPPVTPDIKGIVVERWYERFDDGRPVTSVKEGDIVRVRLRVTVPADRQFVAVEDPLPAGLEPVDLSLRTSGTLQPFVTPENERAAAIEDRNRDGPRWQTWLYGRWDEGWWSPWEHKALHDDRVVYFARMLWRGSYTASYVARATTAGTFVRPPAHAEEMYNPGLQGRSDGGRFSVEERRP